MWASTFSFSWFFFRRIRSTSDNCELYDCRSDAIPTEKVARWGEPSWYRKDLEVFWTGLFSFILFHSGLFLTTSSAARMRHHFPHVYCAFIPPALSSSEFSFKRIGFTSLVLLWARAREGVYYIINLFNFIFHSSIFSPLFSRFCFVLFLYRGGEETMLVCGCM